MCAVYHVPRIRPGSGSKHLCGYLLITIVLKIKFLSVVYMNVASLYVVYL